ncbi:MAG: hypothetical protein PHV53_03290 [Fermentimonas sp.]|nr:hypothetical protein [Fermentimonas sp.]
MVVTPEKALLDLLYLYPFYDNEKELEELRLDDDFLQDELNKSLQSNYYDMFESKALSECVHLLLKTYDLWYRLNLIKKPIIKSPITVAITLNGNETDIASIILLMPNI